MLFFLCLSSALIGVCFGQVQALKMYGVTQVDNVCTFFEIANGQFSNKTALADCPKTGGGKGNTLQATSAQNGLFFFTYSVYGSGAINAIDVTTGKLVAQYDVAAQPEKCGKGISWMKFDPLSDHLLVLCTGKTFKKWPLYSVDVKTSKVNLVSMFDGGSVLASFNMHALNSTHAYALSWGTGQRTVELVTLDVKTGDKLGTTFLHTNPVPGTNNLISLFSVSESQMRAHFEWFETVRSKPDYSVMWKISATQNAWAMEIAQNMTFGQSKPIADSEPLHGSYNAETEIYSFFSGCWSCYSAKTPRVVIAAAHKGAWAKSLIAHDLLDYTPAAATVEAFSAL